MYSQDKKKKKSAIFLDQGGTLINDNHISSGTSVLDMFFTGVISALRKLQEKHLLFIVTNQSAVGLGKMSRQEAERFNNEVKQSFSHAGIRIVKTFSCMHKRDDKCECIKPKPYFLYQAQELFGVDLERSFVVGDHPHDIEFAANAGATGLYVLTGHGLRHCIDLPLDVPIFLNIFDAADWIDDQER